MLFFSELRVSRPDMGRHEMARNDTFSSHLLHTIWRPEAEAVDLGTVSEKVLRCQIFLTQSRLPTLGSSLPSRRHDPNLSPNRSSPGFAGVAVAV